MSDIKDELEAMDQPTTLSALRARATRNGRMVDSSEWLDPTAMAFYRDLIEDEKALVTKRAQFERVISQVYQVQPGEQFQILLEPFGKIVRGASVGETIVLPRPAADPEPRSDGEG